MVSGASEKETKAVSPKIWQEAVATSSVALTQGEAKSAVAANLAEAITCEIILLVLCLGSQVKFVSKDA